VPARGAGHRSGRDVVAIALNHDVMQFTHLVAESLRDTTPGEWRTALGINAVKIA